MSYCSKCGTKLDNDMKFCPKCGERNRNYINPGFEKNKKLLIVIAALILVFIIALVIFLKIFDNIYDKNHADDEIEVYYEEIEENEEDTKEDTEKEVSTKDGIDLEGKYFSILLPDDWKNNYVWEEIENSNGYYMGLYEKTANESEYGGWLFSIAITEEDVFYEPSYNYIGNITINGKEKSVIVVWPTDVQFTEASADQYMEMMDESEDVVSTIAANKGFVLEKSDYIFGYYMIPGSDMRYLTEEEIEYYDKSSLRIARNEIFARHGLIFKSSDLREHFESTEWYDGRIEDLNDIHLNEYEKANVNLIKELEDNK